MTLNRIQAEAGQREREGEGEETGDLMLSNCSKLHPPSIMVSLPLFSIPPFFQSSFHSLPCLHSSFSSLSHSPLDVSLTMRQAVLAFPPSPVTAPPTLSPSLFPSPPSHHFTSLSSLSRCAHRGLQSWSSHICTFTSKRGRDGGRERVRCVLV